MKKKIVILSVALMLVATVVSASSLNGEYKGNPIVKVRVNGNVVNPEVPAQIIDGSTLLPLRVISESLGANVTWNQDTYSVDIKSSVSPLTSPGVDAVALAKEFKSSGIDYVTVTTNGGDFIMLSFIAGKALSDILNDANTFANILQRTAGTSATFLEINGTDGQKFNVLVAAVKDFLAGKINQETLNTYYRLNGQSADNQTSNTPSNPINTAPINTSPITTSTVIESKIDGDFEGWEGDTIFKLQNGQIWQQDSYAYKYSYKYSPKVLIYKSGSGYKMKVDGIDTEIYVKQLK
jgi:hypothetical protein